MHIAQCVRIWLSAACGGVASRFVIKDRNKQRDDQEGDVAFANQQNITLVHDWSEACIEE
jgi:hypothetical protein